MEPPVATFGQVWGPKRWKASDGDPPSQEGERREALKPASAREKEHQASSTPAKPIGAVRRRVKRNPLRRCSWSVGRAWGLGQGNLDRGSLEGSVRPFGHFGRAGPSKELLRGAAGGSPTSYASRSAPDSRGRRPINLSGGGDPSEKTGGSSIYQPNSPFSCHYSPCINWKGLSVATSFRTCHLPPTYLPPTR